MRRFFLIFSARGAQVVPAGRSSKPPEADHPLAYVVALLVVLLFLVPPTGLLSDNEEDYFALAARSFSHVQQSPNTAVFDASPHRALSEFVLGGLISIVGYADAQIIARILVMVCFAFLLRAVFRLFALSAVDAVIVVIIFSRLGQNLIGGEWLFGDYEGKVASYCCVLAAFYLMQTRRTLIPGMLLFALAAYFHFLVGIFWFFASLGLRLVEGHLAGRRDLKRLGFAAALFILVTSPLTGMILWTRLAAKGMAIKAAGVPSPDVIYSIIRAPHHTSPFLTPDYFLSQWLPGYLLAWAMLATCIVIVATAVSARLRSTALWLGLLLAYLFVALALAYLDRKTGVLGKFYLFRPSSLLLLLWLVVVLAYLNTLDVRNIVAVKLLVLAILVPPFVLGAVRQATQERQFHQALIAERQPLIEFLAQDTPPDSVVLIDPQVESSFLDLERLTHRPSLVMWKFMPTNDPEIIEWYRRMEFRRLYFDEGCPPAAAYRVDFVVTSAAHAAELSKSCGPVVKSTGKFALLRRADG